MKIAQWKNIIILGLLAKIGVITITIGLFMDDFVFFEVYRKYIGFDRFHDTYLQLNPNNF